MPRKIENGLSIVPFDYLYFVLSRGRWLDRHSVAITAAATLAIACLTISLSVDSNRQANTANEQFKIIRRQLDVMETDQRPWVKVEASPGDLIAMAHPPANQSPILMFYPHFKMTNVGKSPAFNAQLVLLGYAIGKDHSDPYAAQKEACGRLRSAPLDNPARGHVLFPGDFFDEGAGIGSYIVGFMGDTVRPYLTKENGSLFLQFYVIGCVDYLFGSPVAHHQTGFVDEVWQTTKTTNPPSVTNSFDASQSVAKDDIRLFPGPSSSLAD